MKKLVVGLGEVLWDVLPEARHLGGAPSNFAYITTLMGDRGVVASRVGQDAAGEEALAQMQALGVDIRWVQRDEQHATGVVNVDVDGDGAPRFRIAQPLAWDFLEWSRSWEELTRSADAVCFGSLAQRSPQSRETIRQFLRAAETAVKIFDVNLRTPFYSAEVIRESMECAHIVKLNDEEVPRVMEMMSITHLDDRSSAAQLIKRFDLNLICITRGKRGSVLITRDELNQHQGFPVKIADTVGAGDAFTAGLVHEYLLGSTLARMNQVANRAGAWVASEHGPTPRPKPGVLESVLTDIP
jgi:fructokinase